MDWAVYHGVGIPMSPRPRANKSIGASIEAPFDSLI